MRFTSHDQTLRVYHLRVNCDSNLIVSYISYMHTTSPSSEIPVSFRLGVRPGFGGGFGPQSRTSVGSGPQVRYSALGRGPPRALPKRDSSRLVGFPQATYRFRGPGSRSSLATLAVRLPMTFPTIVSPQNRRAATLALQKPQGSPPYSDRTHRCSKSMQISREIRRIVSRNPISTRNWRSRLLTSKFDRFAGSDYNAIVARLLPAA